MRIGVICHVIVLFIFSLTLACGESQYTVTVKGTITNLQEVRTFAIKRGINLKEVYLQPLRLKKGKYTGRVIEDGKIIFDSDLPKIPLPSDEIFTFSNIILKPGIYIIVAQLLHGDRPFLSTDNRIKTFQLPPSTGSSSILDLGKVYIHLQEP